MDFSLFIFPLSGPPVSLLEDASRTVEDNLAGRERLLLGLALLTAIAAAAMIGMHPWVSEISIPAAFAAAAVAAFLCGSLGLGFGAVLMPALLLLGIEPRVAVASSLIAQLVTVPLGGASHASFGHVRVRIVAPLLGAGFLGTFAGAQFSISIGEFLLTILIAVSTIVMGILVLTRVVFEVGAGRKDERAVRWQALVVIGLVAGFAASAFGTGWGPVGVSLLLLAGIAPKLAVGSSVTARAPIALSATLAYFSLAGPQRVVELGVLVPIVAGGVLGILLGSVAARRLGDRRLRQAVGFVIVTLGLLVFLKV